jgi:hypothetical protein
MYSFHSIRLYIPDGSVNPQLLSRHVLFSIGTLRVASRLGLCGPSEEREPLRGVGGDPIPKQNVLGGFLSHGRTPNGWMVYIYIIIYNGNSFYKWMICG